MRISLITPSLIAFSLAAASWVYGQTASVTGTVTDPAGAVLPGVTITITEVQTNASRTFITDDRGDYRVSLLLPGRYRVEAAAAGFKTAIRENIVLSVDDRLRVDFTLQIGEIAEKLIVTTSTPIVQSETSSVGMVPLPDLPVVPEPLRGRHVLHLRVAHTGGLCRVRRL